MTARILDGKIPASRIFDQIRARVSASSITPGLAVIQVGSDPASTVYVNMKEKRCSECGILSRVFRLPDSTAQEDLLDLVRQLNADPAIHGILVQSPLPGHIDEFAVIETVSPLKDADCFHPCNIGRLVAGAPLVYPCTPAGALHILRYYGIDPAGKRALVVGRSNIVGKPLGLMLLAENASVGWAHSKTRNLASLCREAEILCVAVGKPGCLAGGGGSLRGACVPPHSAGFDPVHAGVERPSAHRSDPLHAGCGRQEVLSARRGGPAGHGTCGEGFVFQTPGGFRGIHHHPATRQDFLATGQAGAADQSP